MFEGGQFKGTRLLAPHEQDNVQLIHSHAIALKPDVIVFPGWAYPAYVRMTTNPALAGASIKQLGLH